MWLAKALEKQGYQGPALDFSCFHHLIPEVRYQGKKDRSARKRQSLSDLETKRRNVANIPLTKPDRVFDKVDIRDKKQKLKTLENQPNKEQTISEPPRRRSTGAIYKRLKDKHLDQVEGKTNQKENKQAKFKLHEAGLYGKQELFIRRENQTHMELAVLDSKRGRRGSGSDRVASVQPISLGRKVEVDLKGKQKKFEGLDRQAEQQSAVLNGKTRPVSWGPSENRPMLKRQTPVDVGFKEKHKNYEQLQRQATTESAVLEGKIRPQFDRLDGRPDKVPISTRADVKLREKQRDFEKLDYQAQKEKAVLEGNLRPAPGESKGNRPTSVVIPKREEIKLGEKKATFEELDRKAEQDASVLRGEHRQTLTEIDGRVKAPKVGLPRESHVALLEKQRTFEAMDHQARKESEILERNKRKSFGSSIREPTPLSTSTRPQITGLQSSLDRKAHPADVRRRNQQERAPRPVSNYYDYSTFQNGHPESSKVYHFGDTSEDSLDQVFKDEPLQSVPVYKEESMQGIQNEKHTFEDRRRDYSSHERKRYDEPERRPEEPMEIDVTDAKNLPYRDMVRAPPKKSRQTFIRETSNDATKEEMPWRKEVREVKDMRSLSPDDEQDRSYGGQPSSPRSELGKAQYRDLVAPPSKSTVGSFASVSSNRGNTEEMPWRREVKDIRRSVSEEQPSKSSSFATEDQSAELRKIRPSSLKRDTFVTKQDEKRKEEMPWRKEVRELKARSRTEEDYEDESAIPDVDPSTAPNLRKLSYKEFIKAPARKQKDAFQAKDDNRNREEMPWRKEVREFSRSRANSEEGEERLQKSSETLVESVPERDFGKYEQVTKSPRKAKDGFVPYEEKTKEEMPWRKEVREMKRTITEDEQVPPSAANIRPSQDDQKELSKFSYRDFIGKPRRKSDGFLAREKKEEEEMPWRKEVRELIAKPSEMEQISQSSRSDLESAPTDEFDGRAGGRNGVSYRNHATQNLSYKDFVCPPSKAVESHSGPVQRKSTKVRDLTRKFADIEADQHRVRHNGPPAQKSLVDVAELKRIERDMKTRSWHGFPSSGYDSDNDYDRDVKRRQRTLSQNEEEESGYGETHQRENVSALDEFDDVFQDPDGYFDQMKVPPPERKVDASAGDLNAVPSWEQRKEFKEEPSSGLTNERYRGTDLSYYSRTYDNVKPFRDDPSQLHQSSDDRIVVKQSWIQSNRVELAESSRREPQEMKQEYNRSYVSQQPQSAEPHYRGFEENRLYQTQIDGKKDADDLLQRGSIFEDKCSVEQKEYARGGRSYYSEYYRNREDDHVHQQRDSWVSRNEPLDARDPREQVQPVKIQAKEDDGMVFGAPIVLMGRRTTKTQKMDYGPRPYVPFQIENERRGGQEGRKFISVEDRSYNGTSTVQDTPSGDVMEPKRTYRPQVFGVFARHDKPQSQQRDQGNGHESSFPQPRESGDSLQEKRRGHMLYLDENDHGKEEDSKEGEKSENKPWYVEEGRHQVAEPLGNIQPPPAITSAVQSQPRPWGSGGFDAPSLRDEQRTGRRRVMNFSDDLDDEAASLNNDDEFQVLAQPVQGDVLENERRRKQKEKEERVREQLRDADYREKYRKELEEKNRKQRENSKYLMNLQMRAALEPDEDAPFDDNARQREAGQREDEVFNGRSSEDNGSEKCVFDSFVAEEDYWQKEVETKLPNDDRNHYDRPRRKRSNEMKADRDDIDIVREESLIHREYRDPEYEARLRKLKVEEELMVQEAERLKREEAYVKQEVDESIIAPTEKSSVEFSIDEEVFKNLQEEDKNPEEPFDENRNHYFTSEVKPKKKDVFYNDEVLTSNKGLDSRGEKIEYTDNFSKPEVEVLPVNGYHEEGTDYTDIPRDVSNQNGDFAGQSGADPEVNGSDGYSIYQTYIHGESNHVICMSCGTSIEKSSAMYIAELDCYWHVNCFCCVVCRAWFGDEHSPVLRITNSMLHCERCYITSDGERCTEV